MLVAYDCWLRISEVSGVTVADVYDTRRQVDPVGRGGSVFLPETKTGRRRDKVSVPDCSMDKLSILSNLHSSSFLLFRCLGAHLKIGGCCAARKHRVGVGYVFIS